MAGDPDPGLTKYGKRRLVALWTVLFWVLVFCAPLFIPVFLALTLAAVCHYIAAPPETHDKIPEIHV